MATDTSVKYFHSGMAGAPTLNNAAGSLLAILRACLCNGFSATTIDSIKVSAGIATATISSGMIYPVDSVLLIAGCANSALNGEKKLASVATYTATFDASGVPDGTYVGSPITAKLAPAGWAEIFTGTNVSAFQSADVKSTKCVLRVDDPEACSARVVGFESMSDVNTGTGRTPLDSQISGGLYWAKVRDDDDRGRPHPWFIFADSRVFYFGPVPYLYYTDVAAVNGFGDVKEQVPNDPFAWFIQGGCDRGQEGLSDSNSRLNLNGNRGLYAPRNEMGAGGSTNINRGVISPVNPGNYAYGDGYAGFAYPTVRGQAMAAGPMFCYDGSVIGQIPGILAPYCRCGVLPKLSPFMFGSRKYLAWPLAGSGDGRGSMLFDVTGPWR